MSTVALHHVSIEEAVADIAAGRMVVILDEEGDAGDVVMAAERVTPDAINFMARKVGGWVRLTLTCGRCSELGIGLMASTETAATVMPLAVTIEAAEGVTTGISTADQALTMRTAADPSKGHADLVVPGHVRPVMARDGGVLERPCPTEAATDLARLAGFPPSAVVCGIQNFDGTMARIPEALAYADRHEMKVISVAEMVAYRQARAQ